MLAKLFNEKCYTLVFFDYKIICGTGWHHYSMFNVGRSMFDVHPRTA